MDMDYLTQLVRSSRNEWGLQKFPKLTDDVDNLKTPPLKKGEKGGFREFRESNPP